MNDVYFSLITVRNGVAKVMFSQACVCPQGGVCLVGGVAWSQGVGCMVPGWGCMAPGWGCMAPGWGCMAPGGAWSWGGAWSRWGGGAWSRGGVHGPRGCMVQGGWYPSILLECILVFKRMFLLQRFHFLHVDNAI